MPPTDVKQLVQLKGIFELKSLCRQEMRVLLVRKAEDPINLSFSDFFAYVRFSIAVAFLQFFRTIFLTLSIQFFR